MRVSELARRAGVAASAIRFYEAEGMLPLPARSAAGYRQYDDTDLCLVRVMVSLRSLGLELYEAGRLAALCGDGWCDEMAVDLLLQLVSRRREIVKARAEIDHLDAEPCNTEQALRSRAN